MLIAAKQLHPAYSSTANMTPSRHKQRPPTVTTAAAPCPAKAPQSTAAMGAIVVAAAAGDPSPSSPSLKHHFASSKAYTSQHFISATDASSPSPSLAPAPHAAVPPVTDMDLTPRSPTWHGGGRPRSSSVVAGDAAGGGGTHHTAQYFSDSSDAIESPAARSTGRHRYRARSMVNISSKRNRSKNSKKSASLQQHRPSQPLTSSSRLHPNWVQRRNTASNSPPSVRSRLHSPSLMSSSFVLDGVIEEGDEEDGEDHNGNDGTFCNWSLLIKSHNLWCGVRWGVMGCDGAKANPTNLTRNKVHQNPRA